MDAERALGVARVVLGNLGLRIVDIAEEAAVALAAHHARRVKPLLEAMSAQNALLHHVRLGVQGAHAVRAGPNAILAAVATVMVDEHDAIVGLVRGIRGAHFHALGVLAVLALLRHEEVVHVRVIAHRAHRVHAVPEHVQVNVVFDFARQLARLAPDAPVKVDEQRVLLFRSHTSPLLI